MHRVADGNERGWTASQAEVERLEYKCRQEEARANGMRDLWHEAGRRGDKAESEVERLQEALKDVSLTISSIGGKRGNMSSEGKRQRWWIWVCPICKWREAAEDDRVRHGCEGWDPDEPHRLTPFESIEVVPADEGLAERDLVPASEVERLEEARHYVDELLATAERIWDKEDDPISTIIALIRDARAALVDEGKEPE